MSINLNKMKNIFLFLLCLALHTQIYAQPANDDCGGLIDLGPAPICPAPAIYNNVDATESAVGNDNFPPCFVGNPDRDVWFSFVAVAGFEDLVVALNGTPDGFGNPSIINPQIAVYRGDCEEDGLVLLDCVTSALGDTDVSIELDGLTPGITYFLRINDWSPSATPNWGAFELCIDVPPPIYLISDGESSDCSGTVYDTGGPDEDYGNNEDFVFTICPDEPTGCILFTLEQYSIEDNFDFLTFHDGDDTNAPEIGELTGIGSTDQDANGVCFQVSASSGCLTLHFTADFIVNAPGFVGTWQCVEEDCPVPEPLNVEADASIADLEASFSSPIMDVTITDVFCPPGAYGTFAAEESTGLGLEEGILLTTGSADEVANPASFFASTNLNATGDPDLNFLSGTGPGQATSDVCIVEMDIFAKSNKIQFDYIFGSDEYKQNFSGFSDDLIAILASGNGIPGEPGLNNQENLALLQNGDIVSIQTVNANDNWEHYRDNTNSQTIAYNGMTVDFMGEKKYLTAIKEVAPCDTYHVKIAIGDTDSNDDSGLFIAPSREGVPQMEVSFNTGIDYLVEGCTPIPNLITISLPGPSPVPLTFDIEVGGTAEQGVDYELDIPGQVSFPVGETILSFPISTIDDNITEGVETIELSLVSDFGCGAVTLSEFTVEIQEEISVSINDGIDTVFVCDGIFSANLTANGAAEYSWTPANLFNNPNSASPTVFTGSSQTVEVTGTVGSCSATDEIFLLIVSPEVNLDVQGDTQLCEGESIMLVAENNVNNAGLTWTPEFGLSDPESESNIASPTFTTTYVVSVEAAEGCIATDEVTLTVEPFDFPALTTTDTTICQNSSVILAESILGSSTTFEWTPTDGLMNEDFSNAIATPDETTTYTLNATSVNGLCTESASVIVNVLPANIEIPGTDTLFICLGDSVQLNTITTTNGDGITWSPVDSLSSETDPTVWVNPTISTWYVATLEIGECLVQDSVYVQVDSLPSLMIEAIPDNAPYCEGTIVSIVSPTYLDVDFPDIEHQWMPATGAVSGDSLFNIVISATETTTYTRISQNNACVDTSEIFIEVVPTPEIMITPESPVVCDGESVDLVATSDSITEFEWGPSVGLTCTDCPDPTATPPTTLTYTVSGEFMGCPASANVTIEVAPEPVFAFPSQTTICEGNAIVLNTVEDPLATYSWTLEDGSEFSTEYQPVVEPAETTTYTLTIDNGLCNAIVETITINVINDPTLTTSFDETTICEGLSASLMASVDIPGGSFVWVPNTGGDPLNGASQSVTPDVSTTYDLVYTSPLDCFTETASVLVNVVPSFVLDSLIATPNTVFEGEDVDLNSFINPTGTQPSMPSFEWMLDGNIIETTLEGNLMVTTPEVDAMEETFEYGVTITDEFGCVQMDTALVTVLNSLAEMPNAFTPNGDDVNNIFRLVKSPNVEVLDFRIYNRWGQQVYELSDDPEGWDGRKDGNDQPADVYVYIIEYNFAGRNVVQKGDVTLIR